MFIAMNRFKVIKEEASAFEAMWLGRESHLEKNPGFVEFHMLRGPEREDHILYSSHTIWESRAAFDAWTTSEHFRAAHRHAGSENRRRMTVAHPEFEGFEVIQTVENPALGGANATKAQVA
jgi:heme-degrading monooxygenase HmoA